MLTITLDWAGAATPAVREAEVGWEPSDGASSTFDATPSSSGWPQVVVVADDGPALWAWLVAVYGADGDEASELASMADVA